jgi:hypothetical protein
MAVLSKRNIGISLIVAYNDKMHFQIPIVDELLSQKNCLALLKEHHVAGLFYIHFNDQLSSDEYKKQWIHNQLILEVLAELGNCASEREVGGTILKGSHLLLDLYTDLGSRFLSDIDILVSADSLHTWNKILEESGFTPINMNTFIGNDYKKSWCKKFEEIEINVELHTRLFSHKKNGLWRTKSTKFPQLEKLTNEYLYVHLCGHLANQHTFLSLYWLFDIYFCHIKFNDSLDWSLVKSIAINAELFRSVQMCMWILKKHFGVELNNALEEEFELKKHHWWKNHLTLNFLLNPLLNKRRYFYLKHATKDRLSTALRYDLSWFYHYKIRALWSEL